MPEPTSYAQGAPCWADVSSPDTEASAAFYSTLFGWDYSAGGEETGGYGTFTKDGNAVAGLGPQMDPSQPIVWSTYLSVDDADDIAARAIEAGGQVVVDPMDVLDFGRMGFIVDPTGAFVGFWQAGTMHGWDVKGEPGAVVWNELATRDPDGAKAFYEAVFGVEVAPWDNPGGAGMDYRIFKADGEGVGGLMVMGDQFPEGVPPHWMTYFAVEDVDATIEQAIAAGGGNPHGPFDVPGVGRIAILTDPFEAHFSVMKPAPRADA
jgi:predicted enzyme related to lactoylglutathione lyase